MKLTSPTFSRWIAPLMVGPALFLGLTLSAQAADRKVKQKVSPEYPALAKQFNASGVVKLSVDISPSGDVRNVTPIGGHPLLIPAAENAVKKWKFEPAKDSTTEVIEFKFVSQ